MALKRTRPILAILALAGLSSEAALAKDGEQSKKAPARRLTFDEDILPIFRNKCADCHDSDVEAGGLDLTRYASTMAGGSSGEVIRPGDPDGSKLFLQVTHQESPFMPPESGKIKAGLITKLRRWIEQGAAQNKSSPKLKKKAPAKPKPRVAAPQIQTPARALEPLSLEPLLATKKAQAVTALAASPSAPLFAAASYRQVLLLNAKDLRLHGILPFPEGQPHVLKFSAGGRALIAGGGRGAHSGSVVVYDVATGERLAKIGAERDAVLAADVDPHLMRLALGGPHKILKVYSLDSGELLYRKKRHTGWLTALAFSPDGVLIASGDRNGGIYVWEADTGREFLELRGHSGRVSALSWRADANALASASSDRSIRIWRTEDGAALRRWNAHGGGVRSMVFGRDGRLTSVGDDRRAKVWNQNGKAERQMATRGLPLVVARSSDGARLLAGQISGQLALFDTKTGKLLKSIAANPPSIAARLTALTPRAASAIARRDALGAALAAARERVAALAAAAALVQGRASAEDRKLSELKAGLAAATAKRKQLREDLQAARAASAKIQPKPGVDGAPAELDAEAYAEARRRMVRIETEEVAAGRLVARLTGRHHTASKAAKNARSAAAPVLKRLAEARTQAQEKQKRFEAAREKAAETSAALARWRAEAELARAETAARALAEELALRSAEAATAAANLEAARREDSEAEAALVEAERSRNAASAAAKRAAAMAGRGREIAAGAEEARAGLQRGLVALESAAKAAAELAGAALSGPDGKPDPAATALWDNAARARALLDHQRAQLALARSFAKSARAAADALGRKEARSRTEHEEAARVLAGARERRRRASAALAEAKRDLLARDERLATLRRSAPETDEDLARARAAVRPLRT